MNARHANGRAGDAAAGKLKTSTGYQTNQNRLLEQDRRYARATTVRTRVPAMARPSTPADPLEAFQALAESHALRIGLGTASLPDAVDALQATAINFGLVDQLGQDEVQRLMAAAFAPLNPAPAVEKPGQSDGSDEVSDDEYEGLSSTFAAACRAADAKIDHAATARRDKKLGPPTSVLRTAEYLANENDPKRLRCWLCGRPASEREAILCHIKSGRANNAAAVA
jgi:hypothetical protein